MIVTNGSQLNQEFLEKNQPYLDWITLSIDSLDESTNLVSGRAISGRRPLGGIYYLKLIDKLKELGFMLKINTVVNQTNYNENMSDFILKVRPKRWKVLQVLPISGQNDKKVVPFLIPQSAFTHFVNKHKAVAKTVPLIAESNDDMKGSYVMIDPAGRFFDNTSDGYQYSKPILSVGVEEALKGINLSFDKFIARDGIYNWTNDNSID